MRTADSWLLLSAAVGAGAVGGFLVAFSSLVMPALRELPAAEGMRAMQSINRNASGLVVFGLLIGTGVLAVTLVVRTVGDGGAVRALVVIGTILFVVGVVGVTGAINVPLNEGLAVREAGSPSSAAYWEEKFLDRWTTWNTVRALAGLGACAAFAAALAQ